MTKTLEIKRMTTEQDVEIGKGNLKLHILTLEDALMKVNERLLPKLTADDDFHPERTLDSILVQIEAIERYAIKAKEEINKMQEAHRTLELIDRVTAELNS